MKKLHISFGILVGTMTFAAIVIALIMFGNTVDNPYTSFPRWAPFAFVGIYYAIGLGVVGTVWLVAWPIMRCKTCKKQNK